MRTPDPARAATPAAGGGTPAAPPRADGPAAAHPAAPDQAQPLSRAVLMERYAQAGERTADDVRARIAHALAQAEPPAQRAAWTSRFLHAQREGFIPAGRIAAHAGTGSGTLANCFVQPLADSIVRPVGTAPGIYGALAEVAQTLHQGGGVGIDFSPLAPRGAAAADGVAAAAGPVACLHLFEASSAFIGAPGRRGGAHMAVLRCDHPDIEAFIAAKAHGGLERFNLAVAVSDGFMRALQADAAVELVHAARPAAAPLAVRRADGAWVHGSVPARRIWQQLARHAHARGDPGVLFIDRINADNNLGDSERIAAANPCGEQPLPPYGACCLGSIDLTRLVCRPFEPGARLDLGRLRVLVPPAVRMLDDAIDLCAWPLPQQREKALATRRIGLGFTGLGDALVMLGLHHAQPAARALAATVARALRDAAYEASVELARERGAFPRFDAQGLLRPGRFASRLPAALQQRIRRHGLRHSHLLSVAPAGSVSLAFADNASTGIEPPLAWCRQPPARCAAPAAAAADTAQDHAWRLYRQLRGPRAAPTPAFVTATELSPQDHLAIVAAVAPYIDGAIAKTVNTPADCDVAGFASLFEQAWRLGLKGVAAYRAPAGAAP